MKRNVELLEGSLWKNIALFSIPLVCTNLLQVLFNMADIAVVGRFAGSRALGSVGSTAILITLFTGILIGLGGGVNVLVARYIGKNRPETVRKLVFTSLIICFLAGLILFLFGWLEARNILVLLKTKEELIDGATLYFKVYMIGMPALALYNFGNAVYSSDGDTKKPLLFLSVSGIVNIILNLIFVIIFKMDVLGVALASVISQYLSAILVLNGLLYTDRVYALKLDFSLFSWYRAKRILGMGLPTGLQNGIFMFANLFIQASVNSFNVTMVEGNSAATNADSLVYDVMGAIYIACASFMSQNYGARKKDRVLKSYFVSLAYSYGAGLVLGVGLILMGKNFLGLFTTDASVVDAGMMRLKIMGLSYAISAFMDCTIAASRGLGKTIIPTFIVIMGSCVFRIIWIFTIFAHYHTISSLYLLYVFSWSITSCFEIIYFRKVYKEAMNQI